MYRNLIIITALSLTACTQAMQESWDREIHNIKTYDYAETFKQVSGYNDIHNHLSTGIERAKALEGKPNNLYTCTEGPAHNRVVTANGVHDEVYYQGCQPQPKPSLELQRLNGR